LGITLATTTYQRVNNLLTLKVWLFQLFVVSLLCNKKEGLFIPIKN
jgi:hypothetical protein